MILNIRNFRIRAFSVGEHIRYRIQKKGWFFWKNWIPDGLFHDFDTAEAAGAAIQMYAANEVILSVSYEQPEVVRQLTSAETQALFEEESRPHGGIFGD